MFCKPCGQVTGSDQRSEDTAPTTCQCTYSSTVFFSLSSQETKQKSACNAIFCLPFFLSLFLTSPSWLGFTRRHRHAPPAARRRRVVLGTLAGPYPLEPLGGIAPVRPASGLPGRDLLVPGVGQPVGFPLRRRKPWAVWQRLGCPSDWITNTRQQVHFCCRYLYHHSGPRCFASHSTPKSPCTPSTPFLHSTAPFPPATSRPIRREENTTRGALLA